MGFLREILRRGPSEEDLMWQKARGIMEQAEGRELMIQLAGELRQQGDNSAIVLESTQKWNPRVNTLTLLWRLEQRRNMVASTYWASRGVRINAYTTGKLDIDYTGSGWIALTHGDLLPTSIVTDGPVKINFAIPKLGLLKKGDNRKPEEIPLEEYIRLTMPLANPHGDYRYGSNSAPKPVKSWMDKKIF